MTDPTTDDLRPLAQRLIGVDEEKIAKAEETIRAGAAEMQRTAAEGRRVPKPLPAETETPTLKLEK